jgi:hypothetical protein
VIAALVKAALGALLGAAAEALNDWRRDRALQTLGYTEAQRDNLSTWQERVAAAQGARLAAAAARARGVPAGADAYRRD